MLVPLVLGVTFLLLLWKFLKSASRPKNFPPGPSGYPIIGAAPMIMKLGETIGSAIMRLSETYGPVMGIRLGKNWALAVTGPEEIREVLASESFAGRPAFIKSFTQKKLGIMFVDGEFWKIQRRFTLRHLRDWGFGKTSLEGVIHEEVEECMTQMEKKLKETSSSTIPIHDLFGVSVVNILWTVMAGKRHRHDDEDFLNLLQNINMIFRSGSQLGSIVARFPLLKYLPYIGDSQRKREAAQRELTEFLEKNVQYHRETRDPSNPRDFIDEYLRTLEDSPNGQQPDPSFSVDQLVSICSDLFGAGAESTSNSLAFAILYMVLYPEVQSRVRDEIEAAIGKHRLVSYTDRTKLPYTEAVLGELQRISSIAPLTPPHSTLEDTTLGGYNIPKGTFTMVNLWALHNDKKVWGDPEKFRPERFLDSEGQIIRNDNLIPFGTGKRACPGEALARMNIFIFFATLVQRYRFELDETKPKPSTVPLSGFTVAPQPFTAKVIKI